jgi:hypothetical protein
MKIEFLASVAVITPDPAVSRRLYVDTIGVPLENAAGTEYFHTEQLPGCKHFGDGRCGRRRRRASAARPGRTIVPSRRSASSST